MTIQPDRLGQSKADLAATIKELRLKSGLSGDRLAQRCHMSQSKISKIENGKLTPSLVDVEQILRALDVPADIAQIERLVAVSRVPSVDLRIIPLGTYLARGPLNTFTIYDEQLVTVETFTGRLVFQDPNDVAEHLELFSGYQEVSLQGDEARGLLGEWAARYRS